jgi:hypothetical protein
MKPVEGLWSFPASVQEMLEMWGRQFVKDPGQRFVLCRLLRSAEAVM